MCAEQRDDDGRVYEDDRVRDDDKRRAGRVAAGQALALLLLAGEVVAAFEEEARDDGQQSRCVGEAVGDGNGETGQAGGGIARQRCDEQEVL